MPTTPLPSFGVGRPSPVFLSPEVDKIFAAMCAAQAAGLIALERSQNRQVNSQFADLVAIWKAVRPIFEAHGIGVLQPPGLLRRDGDDWVMGLTTMLVHSSGQFVGSHQEFLVSFIVNAAGKTLNKTWANAATVTYLRRYALVSTCGIVTGDDDDLERLAIQQSRSMASAAAGAPSAPSAATGDIAPLVGGRWREVEDDDGRLFGDYSNDELKAALARCIEAGKEDAALKAWVFDTTEARLRGLGEDLVPALEARGWTGSTDPGSWSTREMRDVGYLVFKPRQ